MNSKIHDEKFKFKFIFFENIKQKTKKNTHMTNQERDDGTSKNHALWCTLMNFNGIL